MRTCPNCGSERVVKKGLRKMKTGTKQIFLCNRCSKRFPSKNDASYPKHIQVHAMNLHTMGKNTADIIADIRWRYKVHPSRSSIQRWTSSYEDLRPMVKKRKKLGEMDDIICEKEFIHHGLPYSYGYNPYKLSFLKDGLKPLKDYLLDMNDLPDFDGSERCSSSSLEIKAKLKFSGNNNLASRMAKLTQEASRTNRERHDLLERFMLINDSATIAKEVPVYYYEKKIGSITGHIDILQVRFNKVHIMDYKPQAKKERPEAQLYLYARALSFRTGLPMNNIECAWFDEFDHISFSPSKCEIKWSS